MVGLHCGILPRKLVFCCVFEVCKTTSYLQRKNNSVNSRIWDIKIDYSFFGLTRSCSWLNKPKQILSFQIEQFLDLFLLNMCENIKEFAKSAPPCKKGLENLQNALNIWFEMSEQRKYIVSKIYRFRKFPLSHCYAIINPDEFTVKDAIGECLRDSKTYKNSDVERAQ